MVDTDGAKAIASAVMFSKEVGFLYIIFEGDALQIVKEINIAKSSQNSRGYFIE
jgi:hypothetical protein